MVTERNIPTPEEIITGLLRGHKSEELMHEFCLINKGIKEGSIRTKISCWDHVVGFFEMANRMYVKNGEMRLSDAELGIHQESCKSPVCRKLLKSYFEVLKPSQEKDAALISQHLQSLIREIMIGKPRPDLEGGKSIFFDSQTGADLFVTKAVEITDKCEEQKPKAQITLSYVEYSGGMMVDIKQADPHPSSSQAFPVSQTFSPKDEAFQVRASVIGIDPELLYDIILVNAPQEKLLMR
ncbi:hypothetical protein MUP35_01040 [Patescibacteria group bacterium]|nr:hypothetical protein [Patescibacteria group bacterium]